MTDYAGRTLGNYQVHERIGKGGMAAVYLGYQPSMDRPVAIKIMIPELAASENYVKRFQQEARTIATLEHPNIVPVYDAGKQDEVLYLVMRYMPGGTLIDYLPEGGMALDAALVTFEQIALALDYDEHLTATGGILGTPTYMSPEQVMGQELDARSDVYALGVLLYEMLSGRVPYDSTTPVAVMHMHVKEPVPDISLARPDLPTAVSVVMQRALAKDPAHRYQTAREFLNAFRLAAQGQPVTPAASPTLPLIQPALGGPFYYTNAWGLSLLQAAEESLGRADYEGILYLAGLSQYLEEPPPDNSKRQFPFEHVGGLFRAVYEAYGGRGARSLGRFAGKRSYEYGTRRYEGIQRLARATIMRVASDRTRISVGMKFFQNWFNSNTDQVVELEEDDLNWYWIIKRCPICWGWHAEEPVCDMAIGVLSAAIELSIGRPLRVTEIECHAMGHDNCVIAMDKTGME